MSGLTDISDIFPGPGGSQPSILPIRAEKTIQLNPAQGVDYDPQDMIVSAALPTHFKGFVSIRIPGRDLNNPGVFSPAASAQYFFLINPSEVSITRQTVDEQTYARGGWQIGVSGEDFLSITMNGKSAGKYWSYGTTDAFTTETLSYRNLLALEVLFENNGYWFEGEQVSSNLATAQGARRIKMHTDVELTVGEFIWHGMFESFEVTEDADTPFLADFNLVFIAWKETFRRSTPYPNSIGGEVQRGHVPSNSALSAQQAVALAQSSQPLSTTNATTSTTITELSPATAGQILVLAQSSNPLQTTNTTLSTMISNPASGGFN